MSALPGSRPRRDLRIPRVVRRTAAVILLGVLAAYAVLAVAAVAGNWYFFDARGYWETGVRLRSGGELYPPLLNQDHPSVYRYAPWFAGVWMALTFLPQGFVLVAWGLLMAAASVWLLWQLPRTATGLALGLIFAPMLLRVLSQGNVQPLLVAALAWGLTKRSGPILVALAASLKVVPILLAVIYVARREFVRAGIALGITLLLWLPAVAYGLEHYPTAVGGEAFPFGMSTFLIAAGCLVAVFVVPGPHRPLAASLAVTFASPRWIPYNPTYILISVRDRSGE